MAETDETNCNLDELLNLLDDDDELETNCKSSDDKKNTEQSVSNTTTTTTKSLGKVIFNSNSSTEKPANCDNNVHEDNVDPLEKELLQMEQRMKKLKEEIKKKKNIKNDSPGFTKFSLAIDPNSQGTESVRYLNEDEKLSLINNINMKKSEIHKGDTDSEDDEDNRNPFEAQMSSYGKEIKKRIAHAGKEEHNRNKKNGWNSHKSESLLSLGKKNLSLENEKELNTIADPFSGLRIVNPLISSAAMKEMMQNRRMIPMSSIALQLRGGDIEGDWVTIGVIVSKSDTKTSQKGTQYSIWQMSDLKDCTKVVSLFLFSSAYKNLWKSYVGSVVGILNPQIMKDSNKQTDGRNVLTMSVNTHEKVLIMGSAKDLGWCRGRNKEGTTCKQFVNKNICEFCIFHIQKEYKKMSAKRSEIQSSFGRVDPRKAFQKKVLGKDQVFYGGQLFGFSGKESTPRKKLTPATKSKDLATLSSLSMKQKVENLKEKDRREAFKHMTDKQLATVAQVSKEKEILGELLLTPTPGAVNLLMHKSKQSSGSVDESSNGPQITPLTMSAKEFLKSTVGQKTPLTPTTPKLGRGLSPGKALEIEFSPSSKSDFAKAKALSLVKKTGGLQAVEKNMLRNKIKSSKAEYQDSVKKRIRESIEGDEEGSSPSIKSAKIDKDEEESLKKMLNKKKSLLGSVDINSEEFQKLMNKKSSHTNLIKAAEDEEVEQYYNTLEKKEMLENKMASTMEVPTSAVVCLICKYKALSASDRCREEKHPFKVIKAMKRFYECRNCKRRTISLERFPVKPCSNCEQSSWQRVAMGKDKQGPKLESEVLSLRGDELSQVSSCSNKVYLNI